MDYYNNGKLIGKIKSFDGQCGVIVTSNDVFRFDKKDFFDKNIKEGAIVEFYANNVKFANESYLFARDIKYYSNKKTDDDITKSEYFR